MTSKEQLEDLHRRYSQARGRSRQLSLRSQQSIEGLSRLADTLTHRGITIRLDPGWPYHLLICIGTYTISAYCSGWGDNAIELAELDGGPTLQDGEVVYRTARGVANYLERVYSRRTQ